MVKRTLLFIGILVLFSVAVILGWVTDAPAYIGHEASTCNNCHVMDAQYENWYHGAHADVAVCADCHLPHQNIVSYYLFKGYSGMKDVVSFTLKLYPPAIRATAQTDEIIQANCIRCHQDTVEGILSYPQPFVAAQAGTFISAQESTFDRNCWDCHRTTAHGPRGLSLYPYQDEENTK